MVSQSLCDLVEIIPGYRCTERIGAGGYGEVWKVDAPGGLKKALKIVYGFVGEERAERERKALERIKGLRHPYMLSLERVEILQHRLLIVSELADGSLMDRFLACRQAGLTGIPREELIRYLSEAAEALDYLLQQHGLQHLDIKPENLLLLCDHAKVADFGLVKDLFDQSHSLVSGLTPIYAAPETFQGLASRWSDQYGLAVVYQQMLTGTLPYPGRQAAQLVVQQSKLPPDVTALPESDREVVLRALQRRPEARFASCREFIEALAGRGNAERSAAPRAELATSRGPVDTEKETCSIKGLLTDVVTRVRPQDDERVLTQKFRLPESPARPATPSPAADDDGRPRIRVSEAIRRLTPLGTSPVSTLRPVIVIGIGGTGSRVVARLRTLCDGAVPPDRAGLVRFLVFDTDPKWIDELSRPSNPLSIPQSDCLLLPLRRPEEFLRESDRYLAWLSRRWLYNIRPNLVTNGLRPLGRLAWFDHQDRVQRELTARLASSSGATSPGRDVISSQPQVFLIGSVSAGTGGMILDVARAASDTLRQAGRTDARIHGLLLHSTTPQPQQQELARANAFATLKELRHLVCHGETLSSRFTPNVISSADQPWDPFQSAYFLALGDCLDEPAYVERLEEVAEYLFRMITGPMGCFLESVRRRVVAAQEHDVWLRSFKLQFVEAKLDRKDVTQLNTILTTASVPLAGCGYDQRTMLLAPDNVSWPPAAAGSIQRVADLLPLPADARKLLVCCEAEKVSLVQVARTLCADGIDVEDAARRLHSRRDIAWTEMPWIEKGADPAKKGS